MKDNTEAWPFIHRLESCFNAIYDSGPDGKTNKRSDGSAGYRLNSRVQRSLEGECVYVQNSDILSDQKKEKYHATNRPLAVTVDLYHTNNRSQAITVDFYHMTNRSQAVTVDIFHTTNRSQAITVGFYHKFSRPQIITVDFYHTTNRYLAIIVDFYHMTNQSQTIMVDFYRATNRPQSITRSSVSSCPAKFFRFNLWFQMNQSLLWFEMFQFLATISDALVFSYDIKFINI